MPGLVLVALSGCGDSGQDPGGSTPVPPSPSPPAVNAPPSANAGSDQVVAPGSSVTLDGAGSTDANGSIATYAWTQTGGATVTLLSPATATASFTAPAATGELTFQLTVTDNGGASHSDSITVTVNAAPVIGRQPNNPLSLEHGSAMMFVAVSGEELTYEWRRASGAVVKVGPEPFLLHTNLTLADNGDCYYAVVSNSAGTATSEQGCLTVEDIDWRLDPSDDPDSGDDRSYALGFGDALMKMTQTVTGPLTGRTGGARRLGFPIGSGPPETCFVGSYGGTTLDGVMVTSASTALPLGRHTLSESWDDCLTDVDDTSRQTGAYLVEYDFPQTWGVGTLTIHVSDRYFNGTLQATLVADDANGPWSDDIEIRITEDFSAGDMKAATEHSISVDRRYTANGLGVDDTYVDFDALMTAFDADGGAGTIGVRQGSFFHLHQDFSAGDSGEPEYTSTGVMVVGLSGYVLATLEPTGTQYGWSFHLLPDEKCPEGYICADPPGP
jgi:hypothetical protein